jgi:Ribbon-helix-helix protein, copG family
MPVSEVRTQIYLEEEQHRALKRAAAARSVSMAQVVREAVAAYVASETDAGPDPRRDDRAYLADAAWDLLAAGESLGGSEEGADASRLEEELYGPAER